jgi:hypothetical protein
MPIRNPRWLPPQVIVLTQDHMGKYRNMFFSEAIATSEIWTGMRVDVGGRGIIRGEL